MQKAAKFTVYLSIWIVAIFGMGILFTFVNDYIQGTGFFGDTAFVPYKTSWGVIDKDGGIDTAFVWGARHYWYFWMCVLLFLLSVSRMIIWAVWYWDKDSVK